VNESSTAHRLDDRADLLTMDLLDPAGQSPERVDVGRHSELIEMLPLVAQKTDVDLPTAEIQSGKQH
jgi:hypothetical protein